MSVHSSPNARLPLMLLAALQSIICALVVNVLVIYSRLDLVVSNRPSRYSRRHLPLPRVNKTGSSSHELGFNFRVRGRSGPV